MSGPMSDDSAKAAGEALLKNPKFVEMFQKAMGEGEMPKEGPERQKWLQELQTKLAEETEKETQKELETPVRDEEGEWMWIKPDPGFCIKTNTTRRDKKIFINICKHPRIAEPMPIADDEADPDMSDAIKYRIPLSCGSARPDVDKKGAPCVVYDVIVNPATIERCGQENEFRRFVAALCMTWIKQKSEPNLDDEQFTNINIKSKGQPQIQRIRLAHPGEAKGSNAMQDEIKLPSNPASGTAPTKAGGTSGSSKKPLVMEVEPEAPPAERVARPSHTLKNIGTYDWSTHQQPTKNPYVRDNVPKTLDVTVELPGITTIKELEVSLVGRQLKFIAVDAEDGEDSFYEVLLPFPVNDTPLKTKFVRATHVLTMQLVVELPNEVEEEEARRKREAAAEALETAEERAKREAEEAKVRERRERMERIQREEEEVMKERRAMVDNLNAMQEGKLPPDLVKEIDEMSPEQARSMMMRIENNVRRGDAVDTMLDKMPQDSLDLLVAHIRRRLGLAEPESVVAARKKAAEEAAAARREAAEKQKAEQAPLVEYNFAKKAEQLFGVKMENRFVFALEH